MNYLKSYLDLITNFYIKIHPQLIPNRFKSLVGRVFALLDAILGIDSNAHSPLWGSNESNARGEKLEELIMEYQFSLLNRGNSPTFVTSKASSIIDITLVFGSSKLIPWSSLQ